jgi:3-mercaptopyruvate sulfurtransferase SseA
MKTISRMELELWQDDNRSFALIEVLPSSLHQDQHLLEKQTGEFLEKIFQLGISKGHPIVLYEGGSACLAAAAAADVLMGEGFHEVYCFTGPQASFYGTQHGSLQ